MTVFGARRSAVGEDAGGAGGAGSFEPQLPAVGGAVWSAVKNAWMQCPTPWNGTRHWFPIAAGQSFHPKNDPPDAVRTTFSSVDDESRLLQIVPQSIPSGLETRPSP